MSTRRGMCNRSCLARVDRTWRGHVGLTASRPFFLMAFIAIAVFFRDVVTVDLRQFSNVVVVLALQRSQRLMITIRRRAELAVGCWP